MNINYQILARKWRPQLFKNIIGQKYIITALSNSLELGRIHQAWLFSGTRGIGKTTIARILAKGLNCKRGITSNPCRICSNCVEIEQGNFIDLYEVDAASRTKVEEMKELLESIQYLPTKGRFKIYLIDEIHMLSKHSFNSLLKTIEEPPKHIKFILATTNVDKLPDTILSRCLQFRLAILNLNEIVKYLSYILSKEKIPYENSALILIAIESQGSLRDAITLMEQIISLGKETVTVEHTKNILGVLTDDQIVNILITLLNKDIKKMELLLKQFSKPEIYWENILIGLLKLLHQISVLKISPTIWQEDYYYSIYKKRIYNIAKIMSHNDLYSYYEILLKGKKELEITPNKKMGVEMTLFRLININIKTTYKFCKENTIINNNCY